ncbi:MAG: glutamine amidotransferase [Methylovulum sp.]|nr:glutamine amidotransferase [Methylovulum sp.]
MAIHTLTIIKAGSTFPSIRQRYGDFDDWITSGCGLAAELVAVVDVAAGEALPAVDSLSAVIITGSHAMVTEQAAWMQEVEAWLAQVLARSVPVLGICFGHQLLAHAMAGQVAYHPHGQEIGTVAVTLTETGKQDKLLGGLPEVFLAQASHAQTVSVLPAHALRLAGNPFEANHAFRLGENAWGVQFHPEFSADIMQAYVSEEEAELREEGFDTDTLQTAIAETPAAYALLARFMDIVAAR